MKLTIVSTYPPRHCGLATYTAALVSELTSIGNLHVDVLPVEDEEATPNTYRTWASRLNETADVVCLQHEYGLFGGENGRFISMFLEALTVPTVLVPHTILSRPTQGQHNVLTMLAQRCARVVAPSEHGAALLREQYGVIAERIDLIPHGAPLARHLPARRTRSLVYGDASIGGYGLLSPGKGFETLIRALPRILQVYPRSRACIAGITHPVVRRRDGERYRAFLMEQAQHYGVAEHVEFIDRYLDDAELVTLLDDLDVCVAPYRSFEHIVSGTIALALARGCPVVASESWYTREALLEGRGRIVPADDAEKLGDAVLSLLGNEDARAAIATAAWQWAAQSGMDWPVVAKAYHSSFLRAQAAYYVAPSLRSQAPPAPVPAPRFDHLLRMSDETGLLQHASYDIPNRSEGYTTDDNARALRLVAGQEHPAATLLVARYLAFLVHAFDRRSGRFRNVLGYDRAWQEEIGSDECHGRSLQALAALIIRHDDGPHATLAGELFRAALPAAFDLRSLRGMALAALGADLFLCGEEDHRARDLVQHVGDTLLAAFSTHAEKEWRWFEPRLTYFNALLSCAAIACGRRMRHEALVAIGRESLGWLCEVQTSASGYFAPVGNQGWYPRSGARARFDQQPIDAYATIAACAQAYDVFGEARWIAEAWRAYSWYFGENEIGVPLYDPRNGGCRDGIHPGGCNENQGAEATVTFWLSSSLMRNLPPRSQHQDSAHEQRSDNAFACP